MFKTSSIGLNREDLNTLSRNFQALTSFKKIKFPAETAPSFQSKICYSHVLNICKEGGGGTKQQNSESSTYTSVQVKVAMKSPNQDELIQDSILEHI